MNDNLVFHALKKIEIILPGEKQAFVKELLERSGCTGWTLFRDGAEPLVDEADRAFVGLALTLLPSQPWTPATWSEWTTAVKAVTGRKGKELFRPLRRALTGRDAGPEMADVMPLLQKRPGF